MSHRSTEVMLHQVWYHTQGQLRTLADRVAENVEVQYAVDFCNWLTRSGVLELLEANSHDGALKVDGAHLRWMTKELLEQCHDRFRTNDRQPHLSELQLQSINEKLNTIAGYLAKAAGEPGGRRPGQPALNVISGGLDGTAGAVQRETSQQKVS